jgi:hypothetical protein
MCVPHVNLSLVLKLTSVPVPEMDACGTTVMTFEPCTQAVTPTSKGWRAPPVFSNLFRFRSPSDEVAVLCNGFIIQPIKNITKVGLNGKSRSSRLKQQSKTKVERTTASL